MALDQQHWQERLDALADKHGVVGATLAIRHGDETAEGASGVLNLRTAQPATPDSLFQIGSITKVWTATLVMQLVDEGLLDLDEPIVKHLPDFTLADADVAQRVTTRHLLAHTSGIDGDLFLDTGRGDDNLEKYVAAMAKLTQVHPLGATMSYCNSGYSLLGRLVEVLRGQTWDAVLRERLFVPLGLDTAGTLPEEALLYGAATGHILPPGADAPIVTPQWGIFRSCGPAGLIHMTARDLLAFVQMHLAGGVAADGTRVLSAESVTAMQQPQVQIPDPYTLGSHWGLGWILMTWDGRTVIGHDGATLGQGAFQRSVPDAGLSVGLLTNGGAHARDLFESLFGEIFSALAGIDVPQRPEPRADTTVAQPERFVGRYAREGVEMTVRPAEAGGLELAVRGTGPLSEGQPVPPPMRVLPHDDEVLLAKGEKDEAWTAMVFFDLDGQRYVHFGARATPRISTDV
ncbi:MAG: beta-lactamase family protein [Actinobacteria bacterium]|nr:beta-lactamase family protein [Actinomycetota bacterium]